MLRPLIWRGVIASCLGMILATGEAEDPARSAAEEMRAALAFAMADETAPSVWVVRGC